MCWPLTWEEACASAGGVPGMRWPLALGTGRALGLWAPACAWCGALNLSLGVRSESGPPCEAPRPVCWGPAEEW